MNVAFIPIRGGSKSVPLKNIKEIAGQPLIYWTANAAALCNAIGKVYIATDSEVIANVVNKLHLPKTEVIGRSEASATDTASTELALLEFAQAHKFDNVVLIQATSPLLRVEDLNKALDIFKDGNCDSMLSVVEQKRFIWNTDQNGYATARNYDIFKRPRRQDMNGYLIENGAFYITGREALLKSQNRISGKIIPYVMDPETYFEIDEPSDWKIISQQLEKRERCKITKETKKIKMFLTDCDGCLTDGGMYYTENGDEIKKFHTYDGMGFQRLREYGIITGVITGEDTKTCENRCNKLKTDVVRMGVKNKKEVIINLAKQYGVSLEEIAYIGDDINDLEAIRCVGFGAAVANAMDVIKDNAMYISKKKGGEGAVREIIDYLLVNLVKETYDKV